MIHTRRRKAVRINQNCTRAAARQYAHIISTTHAIKPAHAALHTDYSAVVRMIRTSKTMVADASLHPHLMLQRARSIPQGVAKHPQRRWPASQETSRYASSSSSQCQTIPNVQCHGRKATTNKEQGKLLLFNEHFLSSLNRRQARPRLWLPAERSAARSRACEASPRFMRASNAGRRVRAFGFSAPRGATAIRPCGAGAPGRPARNSYADRGLKRRRLAPTERMNAAVAALARTRAAPHGASAKWADAHAGA